MERGLCSALLVQPNDDGHLFFFRHDVPTALVGIVCCRVIRSDAKRFKFPLGRKRRPAPVIEYWNHGGGGPAHGGFHLRAGRNHAPMSCVVQRNFEKLRSHLSGELLCFQHLYFRYRAIRRSVCLTDLVAGVDNHRIIEGAQNGRLASYDGSPASGFPLSWVHSRRHWDNSRCHRLGPSWEYLAASLVCSAGPW